VGRIWLVTGTNANKTIQYVQFYEVLHARSDEVSLWNVMLTGIKGRTVAGAAEFNRYATRLVNSRSYLFSNRAQMDVPWSTFAIGVMNADHWFVKISIA
jgi:hypothetical protein